MILTLIFSLILFGVFFYAVIVNPRVGADTRFESSPILASPPPLPNETITLKIVTFNIADGYLFTTNRRERMLAIAEALTELDPDIVGIQESFVARDRAVLLDALSGSRLKYNADYPAATVGNGLLTLSAYPIVENYFHRYRHNNSWYKIHEGDWWAGKGIGLARIALPCGTVVDFYNTHAQANRGEEDYGPIRLKQMVEVSGFVKSSRSRTGPAFIVGDFNEQIFQEGVRRAIREIPLIRLMNLDSHIDFIFAAGDGPYHFRTVETVEIVRKVQGNGSAVFLSRAPTPLELWRMMFGPAEMTGLSDHKGYMSIVDVNTRL